MSINMMLIAKMMMARIGLITLDNTIVVSRNEADANN